MTALAISGIYLAIGGLICWWSHDTAERESTWLDGLIVIAVWLPLLAIVLAGKARRGAR